MGQEFLPRLFFHESILSGYKNRYDHRVHKAVFRFIGFALQIPSDPSPVDSKVSLADPVDLQLQLHLIFRLF